MRVQATQRPTVPHELCSPWSCVMLCMSYWLFVAPRAKCMIPAFRLKQVNCVSD